MVFKEMKAAMHRRILRWLPVVLVLTLLVPGLTTSAQGGTNLLNNPGFEGFYRSFRYGEAITDLVLEFRIADGWTPWYRPQADSDPGWRYRRPEYRPATYSYNGSAAQQYFTSFGTHQAGVLQPVRGAVAGQTYRFAIAAYMWSSNSEDLYNSVDPGDARIRIGIDPTGGVNPYGDSVVWGPFQTFYDEWRVLAVDAVAQSSALTVFVWSEQSYPVVHNDVALDEAFLGLASAAPVPAGAVPAADEAAPAEEAAAVEAPAEAPAPAAAAASPSGITYTPDVNLKLRASIQGSLVDVVPAGVPVAVVGVTEDGNWVQLTYNGQTGWAASWLGAYSVAFEALPIVP
jgi:hypothetical protein